MTNGVAHSSRLKKATSILMALLLAVAFTPMVPRTAVADEGVKRMPIEDLLAAGNFVEGEAIAIVRDGADVATQADVDELAEVSADSVELAVEGALDAESPIGDETALRMQEEEADTYSVLHVVDHARTTEQILRELYENPDVVSAEPNYKGFSTSAMEQGASDAVSAEAITAASTPGLYAQNDPAEGNFGYGNYTGDLTAMQWGFSLPDGWGDKFTTPLSPEATYSMNVPLWAEQRTNPIADENAAGTVCLMDTGLDVTHPDLKDVVYTFSPEQQARYGCGPYGINASGDGDPITVTNPSMDHGTHVAGIVASEWNEFGTSGVANGAKIFAVRIFGGIGNTQEESAVISGFRFLINVAKEVNLKAVNCSWGTVQPAFAYTVLINELGKKGVNTVFASGNTNVDLDETMEVGGMLGNSPYAICVDAAMSNGKPSEFTSYGQASTDVFAPGTSILSTVPQQIVQESSGNIESKTLFTRFFPEGRPENSSAFVSEPGIERFDGTTADVLFFKSNPALDASAEPVGALSEACGFDDKHSMAIAMNSLMTEELSIDRGFSSTNGYVYLAIPVKSLADAKWVSLECALSNEFKPMGSLASLTCETESKDAKTATDGKSVMEIDAAYTNALIKGYSTGATTTVYQCQWSNMSYNVDGYIEAANEAHARMARGEVIGVETEAGMPNYPDPGKVSGLYGWEHDGKTYVIAKLGIGEGSHAEAKDAATLYVDDVSVGGAEVYTGAYTLMPGTSMAAPAVTGSLAVVAKYANEKANKDMSPTELELVARERAARLLASVDYDDDLSTLCRTGGRVNLSRANASGELFKEKAPLITRATADAGILTVTGYFFGDAGGTLAVDDAAIDASAISSWSDERIIAKLPALSNGSHVVKIIKSSDIGDIRMQAAFSYSSDSAESLPLYEHELSVPLNDAAYLVEDSDRLFGPMAVCDGSLYAITATQKDVESQAMWRYDVASDVWTRCGLPAGYRGQEVEPSGLAGLNGKVYLYGNEHTGDDILTSVWSYEPSSGAWKRVTSKAPSNAGFCAVGDKLLFIAYNLDDLVGGDNGGNSSSHVQFAVLDPETGAFSRVSGKVPGDVDHSQAKITVSGNKIYYYAPGNTANADVGLGEPGKPMFIRFTYDAAKKAITSEDLTAVLDSTSPRIGEEVGQDRGLHFALAGLPNGVAIVGSENRGEDTHIILNSESNVTTYERTSSFYRAVDPLAAYCDGVLYVAGYSGAEPDVMYFRSTCMPCASHSWDAGEAVAATCTTRGANVYTCTVCGATKTARTSNALGHSWDAGKVTKAAAPDVAGVRTFTCKTCKATKTQKIAALPGGAVGKSYKVAGNTYKVTNNKTNAVVFAKAKNAKSVTVPATVKIKGKSYKVTAIDAKAFAGVKKALVNVTIGKNVTAIAKGTFAGCVKLAKVSGGVSLKTIGLNAFNGCKALKSYATGGKVTTIGKTAFANCKALANFTVGASVKTIGASAFTGCKALKTLTVKSKLLTKTGVKASLKGSAIATVKVSAGTAKVNKQLAAKYAKFFTKANCGRQVVVKG